jgi:mannose-6-phosphate isomerase-like protein (cupin superfamily)
MNDYEVARVEGEFVWRSHSDPDDLFLVLDGELDIELRDAAVALRPGEPYVVPKSASMVLRRAGGEARMMLIDPKGPPNTGNLATAVAKDSI